MDVADHYIYNINNVYVNHLMYTDDSIPQGSVLGPSLFLLFMNDMPNAVQDIFINLYADDTLLYYASDNITVIQYNLQLAVDKVIRWFTQNQLKINVTKSCVCVCHWYKTKKSY